MLDTWTVVTAARTKGSLEELRAVYGRQALVSRVGIFNLVHLDSPERAEIRLREAAFDPDNALDEASPLWRKLRREGADLVFLGRKERGAGRRWDSGERGEGVLDGDGLGGGPVGRR